MVSVMMALRGLTANKLRSLLTMLGVIIGVAAVIVAIAIGQGSKAAVAESMQKMGTNVLTIMPGQVKRGGVNFGFGSKSNIKLEEADAILRNCPSIAHVSPSISQNAQVKAKDKNTSTSIQCVGEDYPIISNHPVQEGRFFTHEEWKGLKRVAAIGATTAKDLFDQQSPLGKTVKIKGVSFTVVGLMKEKGSTGFRGNPDDSIYVPTTTGMRRLFGEENVRFITCQARSEAVMDKANDELDAIMRKRHKIPAGGNADVLIFN